MQDRYETISAQPEYSNFSLEEVRLADYERGEELVLNTSAASSATTSAAISTTSAMLGQRLPRSNSCNAFQ
ncbi:hypothetical protein J1614_011629 [Plenodomus biglobosus]|nr:hypothetical protein J1614_011629 [Plenodomus biglobosus]